MVDCLVMANWGFLTSHARVLMCIAHDPGARLRDIAASLGITERSAYGIVTELAEAGYVVKQKDGRRNRYQIQAHLPLPEPTSRERTVGEILALLAGTTRRCDRPEGRTKPPQAWHIATTVEPGPAGATSAGTLHGRQPPHYLHAARLRRTGSCLQVSRRGSTPFQPNSRSSVPDGAGRSTDVIAIAASTPQ